MPNPSPDSPLVTKYEQLIAWFAEDDPSIAEATVREHFSGKVDDRCLRRAIHNIYFNPGK